MARIPSHAQAAASRSHFGPALFLATFALVIVATLVVGWGAASPGQLWPDHAQMMGSLDTWAGRWRWWVGDASEVTFYKHEFASLGLIGGAALAHWAHRRGKRWQGFPICYGTGRWPWVAVASIGGLLLANLMFASTVQGGRWQPTFVAVVSLPAAMVLLFGGGWKITGIAAASGALLVTPLALLLVNQVCAPLGLPAVIGNVLAMALASAAAFVAARRLGWKPAPAAPGSAPAAPVTRHGWQWGMRRVLADFSEAPFLGNELASAGLIGGVLLAALLQPAGPFYGTGWLMALLCGQALASAVGVWVWRERWMQRGWYPTYIPIVSVVPACILAHGGSAAVVVLSALMGALLTPPLAAACSARLPAHVHPYIGNLLSMAAGVLLIVPAVGWILKGAT